MRYESATFQILLGSGVIIGVLLLAEFVTSSVAANDYRTRMEHAMIGLARSFAVLEKTANAPIFDNPTDTHVLDPKERADIKKAIADSRGALTLFDSTSSTLGEYGYIATVFDTYEKAVVLHDKSRVVVSRTKATLDEYDKLVDFLFAYAAGRQKVLTVVDQFNAQTDLNIYAGQGGLLRASAAEIRAASASLGSAPVPSELQQFRAQSMTDFENTAVGFDRLAHGIDIAVDSEIYAAASTIEAAGRTLEAHDQSRFETAVQNSRTLKSVEDIEEVLDYLREAGAKDL